MIKIGFFFLITQKAYIRRSHHPSRSSYGLFYIITNQMIKQGKRVHTYKYYHLGFGMMNEKKKTAHKSMMGQEILRMHSKRVRSCINLSRDGIRGHGEFFLHNNFHHA